VRIGPLADDSLLAARRLNVMSTGVYASPHYLAEHGTPQTPQDLLHHQAVRLLGGSGEPMPWQLVNGDQTWAGLPPGRFAANAPDLLLRMVIAGTGIGAVPDVLAQADVRRHALVRVLPDWCLPRLPISAVFPGRKLMPPKTRVFIEMLQAALGDA
jgi:DNA-binding transcriptional LysR family regulator